METEIMNNIEEVQETVMEEVVTSEASKAGVVGLVVLGVVGAGFVLYKLGKKAVKAIKEKKQKKDEDLFEGIHDIEGVDDEEE